MTSIQEVEKYEIELRSDTFTKPSKGMYEAIMKAEVGDSIYDEDPTIRLLEKKIAEMFGKEASLFMPSGTMANLVAGKFNFFWLQIIKIILKKKCNFYF